MEFRDLLPLFLLNTETKAPIQLKISFSVSYYYRTTDFSWSNSTLISNTKTFNVNFFKVLWTIKHEVIQNDQNYYWFNSIWQINNIGHLNIWSFRVFLNLTIITFSSQIKTILRILERSRLQEEICTPQANFKITNIIHITFNNKFDWKILERFMIDLVNKNWQST